MQQPRESGENGVVVHRIGESRIVQTLSIIVRNNPHSSLFGQPVGNRTAIRRPRNYQEGWYGQTRMTGQTKRRLRAAFSSWRNFAKPTHKRDCRKSVPMSPRPRIWPEAHPTAIVSDRDTIMSAWRYIWRLKPRRIGADHLRQRYSGVGISAGVISTPGTTGSDL